MDNSTTNCIYRIICTATKQNYVGQTVNAQQRWSQHCADLRKGKHHSHKLQEAFWKHGELSLRFEILETGIEVEDLTNREAYWMKEHKGYEKGFNIQYVGHENAKPKVQFGSRLKIETPSLSIVNEVAPKTNTTELEIKGMSSELHELIIEVQTRDRIAELEVLRLRTEVEILIRENAVLRWRLGEKNTEKLEIA